MKRTIRIMVYLFLTPVIFLASIPIWAFTNQRYIEVVVEGYKILGHNGV